MNHEFHEHKHEERSERDRGPRGGGRSRGRGPGGHRGGPFGRGDEMFRGGFGPRGRQRLRRGDVRAAVLVLLEEAPRNGYQIIQELSERSNGVWLPARDRSIRSFSNSKTKVSSSTRRHFQGRPTT